MRARIATAPDAADIVRVYNEGIEATVDRRLATDAEVRAWFDGAHPIVVVEDDGAVVGFAATWTYRPRDCYAGVAEFGVYVARAKRRRGAGKLALGELAQHVRANGSWKLLGHVLADNAACRALVLGLGFREVGIYY